MNKHLQTAQSLKTSGAHHLPLEPKKGLCRDSGTLPQLWLGGLDWQEAPDCLHSSQTNDLAILRRLGTGLCGATVAHHHMALSADCSEMVQTVSLLNSICLSGLSTRLLCSHTEVYGDTSHLLTAVLSLRGGHSSWLSVDTSVCAECGARALTVCNQATGELDFVLSSQISEKHTASFSYTSSEGQVSGWVWSPAP